MGIFSLNVQLLPPSNRRSCAIVQSPSTDTANVSVIFEDKKCNDSVLVLNVFEGGVYEMCNAVSLSVIMMVFVLCRIEIIFCDVYFTFP